jgi:phenylacetate-CoA ligase
VSDGTRGELVVTSLDRLASPVLRYRTGDMVVRRSEPCPCGRTWARLEGGILARADDMVNVRGVNVYPAAIEAVVRGFPEVVEFRSTVSQSGSMRSLTVEIEPDPSVGTEPPRAEGNRSTLAEAVGKRLREALGLTIPVRAVEPGGLPRFEMKARRFVVEERSR